jgi:hypothetical protein
MVRAADAALPPALWSPRPEGANVRRADDSDINQRSRSRGAYPLRFLEPAGAVFSDRVGIVDGPRRITYRELANHWRDPPR